MVVPLQAADLLAYEVAARGKHKYAGKRFHRYSSYGRLLKRPHSFRWVRMDDFASFLRTSGLSPTRAWLEYDAPEGD